MLKKIFSISFFLTLLACGNVFSQIIFKPLPPLEPGGKMNARMHDAQDETPLKLPFWDDFSTSINIPDTSLWMMNSGATISGHIATDAPSLNVAVFNGVDAAGAPYSTTQDVVLNDVLISRPIDLFNLTDDQKNSLYISFFYQARGLGEKPNVEDSIRLQFKSSAGDWQTVWSERNDDLSKESFSSIIPVKVPPAVGVEETFYHQDFQFRLQSFGNGSGDFDNWLIDYVYLNHGRHPADTVFNDDALSTFPTSLFKPYYSLPLEAIKAAPEKYVNPITVGYRNLKNENAPTTYRAHVYAHTSTGSYLFDGLLEKDSAGIDPTPGPFERRLLSIDGIDPASFAEADDIRMLETRIFLSTNDPVSPVNYRVNDTVRAFTTLGDYYAYDDGSAEISAGIGKRGGKLAYMYVIDNDTLTDVDIYFPNVGYIGSSATINLQVWKNLTDLTPLYEGNFSVQQSSALNEFKRYKLGRPVILSDTFYIGYEQNIEGYLPVGYDRNHDSSDRLFYYVNLQNGWEQYNPGPDSAKSVLPGSLMMRPVFLPTKITAIDPPNSFVLKIYPNPSRGPVYIDVGDVPDPAFIVIDSYGRTIIHASSPFVDLSGYPAGVYFIKVLSNKGSYSRKLVLY